MPTKTVTLRRWQVVGAFVILTLSFVGMGIWMNANWDKTNDLVHKTAKLTISNKHQIQELKRQKRQIQEARVHSCKTTYGAFNEVFEPFFPPPKLRTPQQDADLVKLKKTVKSLQAGCAKQTKVKPSHGG